jgi:penicillin-binding protein 2
VPKPRTNASAVGVTPDGRVLACDVERFDVLVHYRWVEDPPDEAWLRQQALSRLSRIERRDATAVEAERQKALERREAMWERLAELTAGASQADRSTSVSLVRASERGRDGNDSVGRASETLALRRAAIQRRVERIITSVERRREERRRDSERPADALPIDAPWWQSAWRTVAATLTTPPRRGTVERLVVREELDYHTLIEDVPLELAAEIEAHPERYPGLRVQVSTRRTYPERSLAAHIVGSRLPIDADELRERR